MDSNKMFTINNLQVYLKMSLWTLVLLTGAYFLINDAFPYFAFEEANYGRYWDFRWSLIAHISGGVLALMIGPIQFWKGFRDKYRNVHRTLGKIYLIAILIASISSAYMALTIAMAIHWTWALSLLGLAFAWFVTAGMAYISIRRMRIIEHQEWMIKSYVVTFAFITFRFIDDLPLVESLGSFIETAPSTIWISWAVPLLVTDVVLSLRRKGKQ